MTELSEDFVWLSMYMQRVVWSLRNLEFILFKGPTMYCMCKNFLFHLLFKVVSIYLKNFTALVVCFQLYKQNGWYCQVFNH